MKTIKFAIMALGFASVMLSCSTTQYYQIVQTKPADQSVIRNDNNDSGYYYEDQNCLITYNFWCESGDAGFTITNKTDQILYVLNDKSFFVRDGKSHQLYEGRIKTETTTYNGKTTQNQTVEQPIIAIAPHSYTFVASHAIARFVIRDCDLDRKPTANKPATKEFTLENAPVVFGNIITYRVGDNGQEQLVKHMFYTSRVTNYIEADLFHTETREICPNVADDPKITKRFVKLIRFAPPTGFYHKYVK